MIVTFIDEIGTKEYRNVASVVPVGKDLYELMFTDYETEEVQGRLTDVTMEGY